MLYKLDIFQLLSRMTRKEDIYPTLTEDEKKGFAPLVVMRWLSGTKNPNQILALNTYANPYIFSLAKHPHLLMRVLQACAIQPGRSQWLAVKTSDKKKPFTQQVLMEFYEYSSRDLHKLEIWPSETEVIEMAEQLGWQKEEITKLKREYKE